MVIEEGNWQRKLTPNPSPGVPEEGSLESRQNGVIFAD